MSLFFALFFGVGIGVIYLGFDVWRTGHLVRNTPTEKVRSVAVGRTELDGVVREHAETIAPPYADEECVYVNWAVERWDTSGDDSEWVTVASGSEARAFDLDDDTGRIRVRADDGASFEINSDEHETEVRFDRGEELAPAVVAFVGRVYDGFEDEADQRRRYRQSVLPLGADVYVFGGARSRDVDRTAGSQADRLEIGADEATGTFIVADTDEETLLGRYTRLGPAMMGGGLFTSAFSLAVLLWVPGPPPVVTVPALALASVGAILLFRTIAP